MLNFFKPFDTVIKKYSATGSIRNYAEAGGVGLVSNELYVNKGGSAYKVADTNNLPAILQTAADAATTATSKKIAKTAITGAGLHAGILNWQNPEAGNIVIERAFIVVSTVATGACTTDIGTTATNATTGSDNLIDGKDLNGATGAFDNLTDAGTNGKSRQRLATGKWVTVQEKTGDATGLVAALYVEYFIE